MVQIKDILVPTDFSQTSSAAVGHASMLAEKFDASLTMLHIDTGSTSTREDAFPPLEPEAEAFSVAAEQEAHELAGLEPLYDLRVKRVVRKSEHPAAEILSFAQTSACDLIVVGTHGRTGLSHLVMGSVAETVIRQAHCPVITVRASATAAQVLPYLNLLVPIDFSPDSEKALHYAWTLAQAFNANLQVLHVVDLPVHPEHYALSLNSTESLGHELTQHSYAQITHLMEQFESTRPYESFVESGRAYSEILEFAATHDTDLIVMGTHGLSRLPQFLLGSTTAKVVRHAPCPVLTVRLLERDFVGKTGSAS